MLKIRTLAILLGLLAAFPAHSLPARPQSTPPDNDRVPNQDPWQVYPRWMGSSILFSGLAGSRSASVQTMALQADGTVHVLLVAIANGVPSQIYYSNNRPAGRTRNGFSAPFLLNVITKPAQTGHIAVGKDGRLTAVYIVTQTNDNVFFWHDLYARQFDPVQGTWGAEMRLTTGTAGLSGSFQNTVDFGQPRAAYDDAGNVHLVYMEKSSAVNSGDETQSNYTSSILYSKNLGSPQTVDTGTVTNFNFPTGTAPDVGANVTYPNSKIAVAPDGTPHLVWTRDQFNSTTSSATLLYSPLGGSTITLATSPSGTVASPFEVDAQTDESGAVHMAYVVSPGNAVYRLKPASGAVGSPQTIPSANAAINLRIGVNGRHKPVVLWTSNGGTTAAFQLQNTVSDPNGWAVQDGLDSLNGLTGGGAVLADIGIDPRTALVHAVTTSGGYFRSLELNTGVQDGFTMIPFGPNATANVATGNLRIEIPLFNARSGFGFGTSFSLIYNSLDGGRATMSPGWSTPFDLFVEDFGDPTITTRSVLVHFGEGRVVPFNYDFTQNVNLAPPEYGNFSKVDLNQPTSGQYRLTTKFGTKYIFDNTGRLIRMEDTQSPANTMTLQYSGGLLTSIQDSPARSATTLAYDSSNRLQKVTDPSGTNTYTLAYESPTGTNVEPGKLQSVNFDGASGQTVKWMFQYHADNQSNLSAMPPVEHRKGMLSNLFTPRGQVNNYSYLFGYKLDSRIFSCTEPQEQSVTDDTSQSGFATTSTQARREIDYVDPSNTVTLSPPYVDEGASNSPARVSPAAQVKDRRGKVTTIEYESARCLADRIRDPLISNLNQTSPQVLRRFFDTVQQQQDLPPPNNVITVPQYRNLKRVVDREGNETKYTYTAENSSTQESPTYVKDNLAQVFQPSANSSDPSGPTGASALGQATATYTYMNFFARVATVADFFQNTTTYGYDSTTGNLLSITYPTVATSGQPESFTYDGNGRVTSHTVPGGGQTKYQAFDGPTGLTTSILLPAHTNPELLTYDPMGNTLHDTSPVGGLTVMVYDNLYRLVSQTPPAGGSGDTSSQATTYQYNEDSQVFQVNAPESSGSMSTYDHLGRLTESQVFGPSGNLNTFYLYDREGNARQVQDPNLNLTTSVYDELSRVFTSQQAGPPSILTTTTYNLNGAVVSQQVGSSISQMTYSGRGLVLTSANTGFSTQADQSFYNEDGTVQYSAHAVNGVITNQSSSGYDNRRRLTSTTQIANLSTQTGFTTNYNLDANGNQTSVTDPANRSTFMTYDAADRLTVTQDNNLQFLSRNIYDDNDRVAQRNKADPISGAEITDVIYSYNQRDELKTQTDINGQVTSSIYDARGHVLSTTTPPDQNGVTSTTVRVYDVAGRLTQETRAQGSADQAVWQYQYDSNGNRTQITDPRQFIYTFRYDGSNRLFEIDYPLVGSGSFVEQWTYDDRGNMKTHTDPNGKVATMTYDLLNRLTEEVHVVGSQTVADIRKNYDDRGNLVSAWDTVSQIAVAFATSNGTTAYDALSRLTEVNWYLSATGVSFQNGTLSVTGSTVQTFARVQYQDQGGNPGYDATGLLTNMVDPMGHKYRYSYDSNGRLQNIFRTPVTSSTEATIATIAYYPSGLRQSLTYMPTSGSSLATETWTYDSKYRLQELVLKRTLDGTKLADIVYGYDARDRRISASYPLLNLLASYRYDQQDRLTFEQWTGGAASPGSGGTNNVQNLTEGNLSAFTAPVCATPSTQVIVYSANWMYDPSGNRTEKSVNGVATTYLYDAQNRLTTETAGSTSIAYAYDSNGNQTSRTVGTTQEIYAYDFRNRVKMYQKGPTGGQATVSYMYLFAPTDERIAKVNILGGTNNEEWYMSDGGDVTTDYLRTTFTGTGTPPLPAPVRTYVNGRSVDSKIARIDVNTSGETMTFYSGDALGSVHEMMDAGANIVRRSLYTAWGEDLGASGSEITFTPGDRYSFTQRENDSESALMHYRARSYNPRIGRMNQRDPLVPLTVRQHYLYAENQPTSNLDPTGLWSIKREKKAYALAISDQDDTIEELARQLGFEAGEFTDWLRSTDKDLSATSRIQFGTYKIDTKLPAGKLFSVPNTILVFRGPAKLEGESRIVTEDQIMKGVELAWKRWGDRGFLVKRPTKNVLIQMQQWPAASEILADISSDTQNGTLHGFVGIGHTGIGSVTVMDNDAKETGLEANQVAKAINYKLSIAEIVGCYSWSTNWLQVVSSNGGAYGTNKLIHPWDFDALMKIDRTNYPKPGHKKN